MNHLSVIQVSTAFLVRPKFLALLALLVYSGCGNSNGRLDYLSQELQPAKATSDLNFIVVFDSQSAETDAVPNFKTVKSPATNIDALPSNPVKSHFTFDGWFTGKEGTGSQFTAATNVPGNITVYTKWTPELTVKIGSLLWKKCSDGQKDDGICSGNAYKHQLCSATLNHTNCPEGSFSSPVTYGPAYDRCQALNTSPSGGFAGKTNWRLPSSIELQSLANSFPNSKFPNTVGGIYWSNQWALTMPGVSPTGMVTFNVNGDLEIDPDSYTVGQPTDFFYLRCVADDP